MTLIIGGDGSMGRRYKAILNYLEEPWEAFDINGDVHIDYEKFDRFIVATPTHTHFRYVQNLSIYKKPILVEKPLSYTWDEVVSILKVDGPVSMMMQYRYFDRSAGDGPSWYNFYNHGKDGIIWDCFQIIALAKSSIHIDEDSPIWSCCLNGEFLDLREMDKAYIWAVKEFLEGKIIPKEQLLSWHKKVRDFEEKCIKQLA